MAGASDYLEAAILAHIFEGSAYTQPTVWAGLSIGDPGDDGAALSEPSGGSYARVRPADDSGRWTVATAAGVSTAKNKGAITFPEATGDWGVVTHLCLFDADTAGNLLAVVELDDARTILTGDTFIVAVNDLVITLD